MSTPRKPYTRQNTGLAREVRAWLLEHPGTHHSETIVTAVERAGTPVLSSSGRPKTTVVAGAIRSLLREDSLLFLPGLSKVEGSRSQWTYAPAGGAPVALADAENLVRIGTDNDGNALYRDSATGVLYRVLLEVV